MGGTEGCHPISHLARLKASSMIWARLITGMTWETDTVTQGAGTGHGPSWLPLQPLGLHTARARPQYLVVTAELGEEPVPVLRVVVHPEIPFNIEVE